MLTIAVVLFACGDDGGGQQQYMDAPASSSDAPRLDAPRGDGSMSTVDAAVAVGPACGATTCMNGVEDCCIGTMNVCKAAGTCPSQGFTCDGPEDCTGGATCCYANNAGTECKTQNCQEVACHQTTDCPGAMMCCPKSFTPNYNVCQVQC